jgi:molybdate transport system regulatory protein
MSKHEVNIRPRLRVMVGRDIALGPGKIELLEHLQKTGSITKAARAMDMSYMRAWTLIRTMNRLFKQPLVVSTHGGAHGGGGAELTEAGREILSIYQAMDAKCLKSVGLLSKKLAAFLEGKEL